MLEKKEQNDGRESYERGNGKCGRCVVKLTPRPGGPQGLAGRIFGKGGVATGTQRVDGKIMGTLISPPSSEPVDRNKSKADGGEPSASS